MSNAIVNWVGMITALGWKSVTFPGAGLAPTSATQWGEPSDEESAFLKKDEYGSLIDDPTAFLLNTWFPRFTRHIQPPGSPVTLEHNMALINGALSFLMYMGEFGRYGQMMRTEAGVVAANAGTLKAPLDILADKMRGYINLSYDLFERKDQVMAACEALAPHLLKSALGGADPEKLVPVTIWMHRGGVPFVSGEIFRDIYWATLKPIVEEIWAAGHQVLFYAEGNWDAHLRASTSCRRAASSTTSTGETSSGPPRFWGRSSASAAACRTTCCPSGRPRPCGSAAGRSSRGSPAGEATSWMPAP
jgi:hypothetical protein